MQCESQSPAPLLKKATKRGHDEVKPQRDRYVLERLLRTILRRGGKRGGETESYSKSETEEGERVPSKRGREYNERQRETKSLLQLHRDRLFELNCVLWTSEGL